jgi:hypothetical protein
MVIHGKRLAQARLTSVKAASTENVYAATALATLGVGLETTKRKEGPRRLGLATRTAAISSLKALRFMVAMLP